MPLIRIPGEQAVENRKTNPYAGWDDRASMSRIEPIAKPAFKVPFKLQRGCKIFTVGSCFARNVEDELVRRGFDLPMRKVILGEAPTNILNNYGTPSIYNEFAWAFGEQPYTVEDHIVEVRPGKFADLHLSPEMRPDPLERVLERRRAITAAYKQAADCPVMVMTLGLAEVWFDTKSGCHINVSPRPSHLRSEPKRFELHVLSYEECHDYLERTIQILKRHCRPDLQLLLTVSPVPLFATHRTDDVMVANTYSKSVQRTVVEALVAKHDFITYYPSYESVILSDRQRAWREDLIHVAHELVALNVSRMVDAFIEDGEALDSVRAQIEAGGAAIAVEKAKAMRNGSHTEAAAFFAEFGPMSKTHADFALEHAQFLADTGDFEGVLNVFGEAPPDIPELTATLGKANALVKLGRAREAVTLLDAESTRTDGPKGKRMRVAAFWYAFLNAAQATGDEALVVGVLAKLVKAYPIHAARANTQVGRWFFDQGKVERAVEFLKMAISVGEEGNQAHLYLAEAQIALGMRDEARETLSKLQARGRGAEFRADRLMEFLE